MLQTKTIYQALYFSPNLYFYLKRIIISLFFNFKNILKFHIFKCLYLLNHIQISTNNVIL